MNEEMLKLNIPDKIKVGYQNRAGTYTGQLAYVIYFDNKGVLRKEKSWESWRDKKIEPQEFSNEPTEGFVLNKSGGGRGSGRGWNDRNAFIRVYDPRGFEFEIGLSNLLFILRETDCSRGKGLEGKFVYAWGGTELVLLPAGSADYKSSKEFTSLQSGKVKLREMVPGTTFITKQQDELTFLGKFDYYYAYNPDHYRWGRQGDQTGVTKKLVFWDGEDFVFFDNGRSLAALKSDQVHPEMASLVTRYAKSAHGSPVRELFLKEVPSDPNRVNNYVPETWFYESQPGVFVSAVTRQYSGSAGSFREMSTSESYTLEQGALVIRDCRSSALDPSVPPMWTGYHAYGGTWVEPTEFRLFARTEAGTEFCVESHTFEKG